MPIKLQWVIKWQDYHGPTQLSNYCLNLENVCTQSQFHFWKICSTKQKSSDAALQVYLFYVTSVAIFLLPFVVEIPWSWRKQGFIIRRYLYVSQISYRILQ